MKLTRVERRLVHHVVDGTVLDLAPEVTDENIDENVMLSWGKPHEIRAEVVREILRGRHLPDGGPDPHGLQLRGARIVGRIDLDGITTTIRLQLLSCYLPDGLDGRDCVIPLLALDRSVIGFTSGDGANGAVRLSGAHITGQLTMRGATLTNGAGPALRADGVIVESRAFLIGLTARGHGPDGAVRLPGARITGQLAMRGARLSNEAGPALHGDSMIVDGGAFLDGAFTAQGHGRDGAVRLLGAHIAGNLAMHGAKLTNEAGPALHADSMIVEGGAFLDGPFAASAHSEDGGVRLLGAHITGQLALRDAMLANDDGPALVADSLTVDANAFLDGAFTASGHGEDGAVRLGGVHIAGELAVNDASVDHARAGSTWNVDGLTFDGYPTVGFDKWLDLLQSGTPAYRPQPYRQLAAVARAAGDDGNAREALMKQRDDQVKRGGLTPAAKAWATFTKVTLGYGYQPWRALLGVVAVLCAAVIIVFFTPGALAHAPGGTACSAGETFQIAVDMAIPLVSTSSGSSCRTTTTSGGEFVAWASVFLTFSGWAFTALFAAGFTRAIRQP